MEGKIRVVIVDDHPLFREALKQVVEKAPGFLVVGQAGNGEEALALVERLQPQIVVLDLNLPRLSGLEVARVIQSRSWNTRVVVVTMNNDEETFNRAIEYGVQGYVVKENAVEDIANCVRTVADGSHFITPLMSGFLLRRRERMEALAQARPGLADLTTAERRILKLIAQNKTSKQIAKELFISVRTVETHRANASQKLGLRGSHALLEFALRHGGEF